jgi:hypothetical protein
MGNLTFTPPMHTKLRDYTDDFSHMYVFGELHAHGIEYCCWTEMFCFNCAGNESSKWT